MEVEKKQRAVARHLAWIGWGAFLLWVGICWLAPIAIGPALIGVGALALLMQGLRALYGLPVEGFWVAAGLCFGIGGAAQLISIEIPFMPIALLVVGGLVLFGGLVGQLRHHQHRPH